MRGDGIGIGRTTPRSGLEAVAKQAGVGLATVDRVLNERGGVSPGTAQRVIDAARELGLRRVLPTPYARPLRIEVLLARSTTPFMLRLTRAFGQVAATLDRSVVLLRSGVDMTDPASVSARIASCRADGIVVYCEEDPANIAAIALATAPGRPVICIVTTSQARRVSPMSASTMPRQDARHASSGDRDRRYPHLRGRSGSRLPPARRGIAPPPRRRRRLQHRRRQPCRRQRDR